MDLLNGEDSRATCWADLRPEVRKRILSFLSPNELACTVRLINKDAAKQFQGCSKVLLAYPSPHHAFAYRWGRPGAMTSLTLAQRERLCCLTARSGSLVNLQLAVRTVGCPLKAGVFYTAAAAGHLHICEWLVLQGCPLSWITALQHAAGSGHLALVRWMLQQCECGNVQDHSCNYTVAAWVAAAGAGQRDLCEGLLADGIPPCKQAVIAATGGGHLGLTSWILLKLSPRIDPFTPADEELLLSRAAYGLTLPGLKLLASSRPGGQARLANVRLQAQAIISPTPDWCTKLEWLKAASAVAAAGGRGGSSGGGLFNDAQHMDWNELVRRPDCIARIKVLWQCISGRLELQEALIAAAVRNSNLSLLHHLQAEGLRFTTETAREETQKAAATLGNVKVLNVLPTLACPITYRTALVAVACGHLHVLEWLAGAGAGPNASKVLAALRKIPDQVTAAAAGSGNLVVLEWLWDHGYPQTVQAFTMAVVVGNVEIVKAMMARGCYKIIHDAGVDPYVLAGKNEDFVMLCCLRQLGWPWDSKGRTFNRAVLDSNGDGGDRRPCSLAVLRWLVAEGCPVDWEAARQAAGLRQDAEAEAVGEWVLNGANPKKPSRRAAAMRRILTLFGGRYDTQ